MVLKRHLKGVLPNLLKCQRVFVKGVETLTLGLFLDSPISMGNLKEPRPPAEKDIGLLP